MSATERAQLLNLLVSRLCQAVTDRGQAGRSLHVRQERRAPREPRHHPR